MLAYNSPHKLAIPHFSFRLSVFRHPEGFSRGLLYYRLPSTTQDYVIEGAPQAFSQPRAARNGTTLS